MKERARPRPCRRNALRAPGTERREGERFHWRPGGQFVQGLWFLAQSLDFMVRALRGHGRIFFTFILKR